MPISYAWPLAIPISLYFVQVWPEIGGRTLRFEDVVAFLLIVTVFAVHFRKGKIRLLRTPLNTPLLAWAAVIVVGACVTLVSNYSAHTKEVAVIMGSRLLLAIGLYFAVANYPARSEAKAKVVLWTIVAVSAITTLVSLLQIAYWAGFPVELPSALTTFKPGANMERGREIFALYLGDTGTHTWSAMLAVQIMVVFFLSLNARPGWLFWGGIAYSVLLLLILLRLSVRNSILGLAVGGLVVFVVSLIGRRGWRLRVPRRVFNLILLSLVIGTILLFLALEMGIGEYYIDRVLQVIPRIEKGQLVVPRGSNIYGRLEYYQAALDAYAQHPFTGIGYQAYEEVTRHQFATEIPHPHNAYLQALAEFGIIGLTAVLWVLWRGILQLRRKLGQSISAQSPALRVAISFWTFLIVTAFFSITFLSPTYLGVAAVLMGLLQEGGKDSLRVLK